MGRPSEDWVSGPSQRGIQGTAGDSESSFLEKHDTRGQHNTRGQYADGRDELARATFRSYPI